MHPQTDIVCLVHNQLAITKGFVQHLFENTENFNLIFVDNGSTDETPQFLADGEKNGQWTVVSPHENLGVIGGRNLGAKSVTADYFLNIDNDQYVRCGWLDGLHRIMERGYDIVGCEAWHLIPPKSNAALVLGTPVKKSDYYPHRRCTKRGDRYSYIGCGGMLIRKKVYDDIGLFDEQFSPAYFEDPDFCFRAIQAGYKLAWWPDCPIKHLAHQTIGAQQLFNKQAQFLLSWKKFQDKWKDYYPGDQKCD